MTFAAACSCNAYSEKRCGHLVKSTVPLLTLITCTAPAILRYFADIRRIKILFIVCIPNVKDIEDKIWSPQWLSACSRE
jgi:hypothetical protein